MIAYKKTTEPTLKKFHLKFLQLFIFLIFLTSYGTSKPIASTSTSLEQDANSISIVVYPEIPSLGDTITVKIPKSKDKEETPKVFFDKTKLPVFELSSNYYRTLIPISANFKPGGYQLEIFYKGLVKKIELNIKDTKYPLQELTLSKEVAALRATRVEKALVAKAISTKSPKKLWNGKFIPPSTGSHSTIYGVKRRINGVIDPDYFHKGLDFAAASGSVVKAPESGKVILSGHQSKGFVVNGNCIFLDHGHGVVSTYLHLSKILVKEGDYVQKGQIIGQVGSTGIASGPHLHWGVYVLGKTVDPLVWTSIAIE